MKSNGSSTQPASLCETGNRINARIESRDYAEVRKGLDECCSLLEKFAAEGNVDPYLTAKLTLAFLKGLAITEQQTAIEALLAMGKLLASDPSRFSEHGISSLYYDGMTIRTSLSTRSINLFGMGVFYIGDELNCRLGQGDMMVFHQIRLIERILFRRENKPRGSEYYSGSDESRMAAMFAEIPALLINYVRHKDKAMISDVMGFWEYSLDAAYGTEVPRGCAVLFAESFKQYGIEEHHHHFELLPMIEWELEQCGQAIDDLVIPEGRTLELCPAAFVPVAGLSGPMLAILGLHLVTGVLGQGIVMGLCWSGVAVGLAAVFYRVSMLFVNEIRQGVAPYITLLIYVMVSFASIGAFATETIPAAVMAALLMNAIIPAMWGIVLLIRRGFINATRRLLK